MRLRDDQGTTVIRSDDNVLHLDSTEEARVIVVEDATPPPGIPVYVRECYECGGRDTSEWFFGPDRDLGLGWTCPTCDSPDTHHWIETTLTTAAH